MLVLSYRCVWPTCCLHLPCGSVLFGLYNDRMVAVHRCSLAFGCKAATNTALELSTYINVRRYSREVAIQLVWNYTGRIKMIGAVLKLIIFTSMVNRIINIGRNERVTQQVYDTHLQMFDVTRHTSRR